MYCAELPMLLCYYYYAVVFRYHSKQPSLCSEGFHYKRGVAQVFSQPTHLLDPSKFAEEEVKRLPQCTVLCIFCLPLLRWTVLLVASLVPTEQHIFADPSDPSLLDWVIGKLLGSH